MFDVNAIRADFPGSTQQVYLNAAGVGLPPRSALDAVQQAVALLGQGPAERGYKTYYRALGESTVQAREEGARLLNVTPAEIAFIDDTTKWLNAPFGVGLLYIRQGVQDQVRPGLAHGLFALAEPAQGWVRYLGDPGLTPFLPLPLAPDARRFEIHGMPKTIGAAGLAASLAYVNGLDQHAVTAHIMALGDFLIEQLKRRGITVWTPAAPLLRSGVFSCEP